MNIPRPSLEIKKMTDERKEMLGKIRVRLISEIENSMREIYTRMMNSYLLRDLLEFEIIDEDEAYDLAIDAFKNCADYVSEPDYKFIKNK